MTKVVTPSTKTIERKINKAVANYRAMLEKHSVDFDPRAVQKVLEHPGLIKKQFEVFRRLVGAREYEHIENLRVMRGRSAGEVLEATRCTIHTFKVEGAVKTMPEGKGDEVELVIFTMGVDASYWEVHREYESRNLISDPVALADFCAQNPDFFELFPIACQWMSDGKTYTAMFYTSTIKKGEKRVDIYGHGYNTLWSEDVRFAGVRKKSAIKVVQA